VGWGDELMAAGEAQRLFERNGKHAVIVDKLGNIRKHLAWAYNPIIRHRWDRVSPINRIQNGPSVRPYIQAKTLNNWLWKPYAPTPAVLYFDDIEKAEALRVSRGDFIVLEPNLKPKASPNKSWGRLNWMILARLMRKNGLRPVQLAPFGAQVTEGIDVIRTHDFRIACSVLAHARAAVLPEGGLHHAAAAVGTRAVVIYGGFISPAQTGYTLHRNIFTGGEPCGRRQPCPHCAEAMKQITPELIMRNLLEVLK